VFVILPTQLFQNTSDIKRVSPDFIALYEHPSYFTKYKFHKLKLVFHRATMKKHHEYLKSKFPETPVLYIEFSKPFESQFSKKKFHVFVRDINDHSVSTFRWFDVTVLPSQSFFLNSSDLIAKAAAACSRTSSGSSSRSYSHSKFYKFMRTRYATLLDADGSPTGGKWSFDSANRDPFPQSAALPDNSPPRHRSQFVSEARLYVSNHFPGNCGDSFSPSLPPISHVAAKRYFKKFLSSHFHCFGQFQDAVSEKTSFGCHSNISSSLNAGLLTPAWVVREATKFGLSRGVAISSVEGFVRQVLGWREFCHMLYVTEFDRFHSVATAGKELGASLDRAVWYRGEGSTGIPIVDSLIAKALTLSYLHHIERLMYIGGFMTISQIHPKAAHDWFISVVSLDAYHWVMYPNVFGMAVQSRLTFGLMVNREYFSSSRYILRMSDASSGEWESLWNSLYYYHIWENEARLSKNYAAAAQVSYWNRKTPAEKKKILRAARAYLAS
jgi:deoxyribodipyrimidine photolyase-related protein